VLACPQMPPSFRMLASGVLAVLVGACFDFDATTAGGLLGDSGSHPPTLGSDASVSDDAAPPIDSGAIVDEPDGGQVDAGSGPDGSAGYCASIVRPAGAFFCDDFDETGLPGPWDNWFETAGTLVETDASAVSAPNSVVETTSPLTNGEAINTALRTYEGVPTLPATIIFAFSLEPVQIDPTGNAAIVVSAIDFLDGEYRYSVGLSINVSSGQPLLELGEQSGLVDGDNFPDGAPPTYVNHPLPPNDPLAMNQWSTIVIELDWSTMGFEGKVSVNGVPELATALTLTVAPTQLQIGIGTSYVTEYSTGTSPVWELRYDNVLFTTQ
jgi:hypothetical protein